MSSRCCDRARALDQARRAAEKLLGSRELEEDLPQEGEPMKRYIHPIPFCCPPCPPSPPPELDGVLEALARQNQLLLDILGAVNALSAAVLSIQSRM